VGVIILVFITALIFGLQRGWVTSRTDALLRVTSCVVDAKPTPLADV
jgi:hypothetical protein